MAKFDIKTVKPKFVVTTSPDNKIDVVVNKPIITSKNTKSFFQLKNTGGPKGSKGDKGDPGQDSTIEVISTTTGAAGTNASVVNQGTASAAQLAFTIPRGDTGAQGVPGYSPSASVSKSGDTATITITDKNGTTTASVSDGADGQNGYSPTASVSKSGDTATITITDENGTTTATVSDGQDGAAGAPGQAATIAVDSTSTLPAGSSATVTNVGTSSAARLAFGIPKGDTGAAGQDGDAATITVGQVETLAPNQPAYVNNVGTTSAAIFNIGIPKGDKGDAGAGTGDMLASTYDPNGDVAAAGGIPDYVAGELPAVNDATLTIQKNGTTVNTFTANSSSNVTANITVPTQTSDLTNNGSDGTSTYVEADDLATVATSGSYSDLSNKPTIPAAQVNSDWNSNSGVSEILNKPTLATVATTGAYSDLSGTPSLATVATSGSYTDLSNKPTIPTVNDATLTITQNGTSKGTFSANASSPATIALTDTTYSDFTGATSLAAGAAGLVPAPTTSDPDKFLKGDGTWATVQAGSSGLVLYANNSLHTPASITGIYSDSGLTTVADTSDMIATIDDGGSVVIKYSTDEAVALTSYDDHALGSPSTISFTGQFLGNWKGNNPQFIKFTYNTVMDTWSAEGVELPTDFTGASAGTAGTNGLVPAPAAGDQDKYLKADGTWASVAGATLYSSTGQNTDGAMTQKATTDALADKADTSSLAAVATSGSYTDLSNKPTIPTVNNATLTIQKNGTTVKTFTANASSNVTCNITTDVTSTTSQLDVGTWHFYYYAFTNSTSGLFNKDFTVPSAFAGKVKCIWGTGRYGNSGDNYVAAWVQQSGTTYRVRCKQGASGSNGWDIMVLAIY